MKKIITILITLLTVSGSFAQDADNTLNIFYILEDVRGLSKPQTFQSDNSPCYIQIVNNEAQFTGQFRTKSFFLMGDVEGVKETIDDEKNKVTSFFVRGRERSSGNLASFELIESTDGDLVVHFFKKSGGEDYYFNAHVASEKEISVIKKYWSEH